MPIIGCTLLNNIPWEVIAPHERQAIRNHGQSLEVLASRGGLGVGEAIDIIEGRRWGTTNVGRAAEVKLINMVRDFRASIEATGQEGGAA
jgi:hypothetical protein